MNNDLATFVIQIMNNGQNPQQVIQQMINQNPNAQTIFNQMQQSGMSIKDFTMQLAKQKNIDLQPTINLLYQRGIKF